MKKDEEINNSLSKKLEELKKFKNTSKSRSKSKSKDSTNPKDKIEEPIEYEELTPLTAYWASVGPKELYEEFFSPMSDHTIQ